MKKSFYFLTTFFVIIMFAVSVSAFFPWSKEKEKEETERTGIVNFYSGEVNVITGGQRYAVDVGDIIKEGMAIKTGSGSFVDIHFGRNIIKVLENTTVEISVLKKNINDNSETTEFLVKEGSMLSRVGEKLRRKDSYTVRTPTSIAGVRGTDFLIEELNRMTNISCVGGSVEVRGAEDPEEKTVTVKDGYECSVKDGFVQDVRRLSEENRKRIEDIVEDIREVREEIRNQMKEERDRFKKDVKKFDGSL